MEVVETIDCGSFVNSITCSRRKFLFALVGMHKIQIWDAMKLTKLHEFVENGCTRAIANDNQLYVACKRITGPTVEVYNLGSLTKTNTLQEDVNNGVNMDKFYNCPYLFCGVESLKMYNTANLRLIQEQDVPIDSHTNASRIRFVWCHACNLYLLVEDQRGRRAIVRY